MTRKHPMACQPLPIMEPARTRPSDSLIGAAAGDLYDVVERLCEGDFGHSQMMEARRVLQKARGEAL